MKLSGGSEAESQGRITVTATASAVSRAQAGRSMSVSDIYANARGLSGYLKEKSAEIEEARRLPKEVVARIREAGMFRLMMPKSWGGPELSLIEQVEGGRGTLQGKRLCRMARHDRVRLRLLFRFA